MTIQLKISNAALTILAVFTLITGCEQVISARQQRTQRYTPVYAPAYKSRERHKLKTLQGDFTWAAESDNLPTAAQRWKIFLERYAGPDKEYEDGFDTLRVEVAKYELMRVYYLLGNVKAGDKLLSELDPLKLSKEKR